MECYRDQREREEREREQFAFNVANAGADVVGLAGAFAGAVNAHNNYRNLKNECNKLQKEIAEKKESLRLQRKEKINTLKENDGIKLRLGELNRKYFKTRYETSYEAWQSIQECPQIANRTPSLKKYLHMTKFPSLPEYINSDIIEDVNKNGVNCFHEKEAFFSMFTPEEIAAGYPSNELFSWANEEQIALIVGDLIPCYGQRIVLFGNNLKYLNEYQVSMLNSQQIQAIKNERFNFPQNSPIYKEIYQYHSTYGRGKDYSNQNVPKLEEDSNCCLLI